jgi:hypothetical protein
MWCKSIGFVRWLAPLLILRSVGFLFYVLSVCSLFAGCLLALGITYLYPLLLAHIILMQDSYALLSNDSKCNILFSKFATFTLNKGNKKKLPEESFH